MARLDYDLGPNIPVGDIVGLRNRVSHDYEGVNWNILEDILFEDIPLLVKDLVEIMNERGIERDEISLDDDYQLDNGNAPIAEASISPNPLPE